ncbi:solute carrier family 28 member 3-like [Aplysia californica]|uniref:Solute carrier family 28 member 3-like n=1 Tax=Aplysia californica TaxID=6500 RepID=A0ABM1VQC7_APLCA|nr:solute carrier family 28 member 3-like [Aplysia californica]
MYGVALVVVCVYLGVGILKEQPQNSQAILGIVAIILFCYITSARPSRVNWCPVFWGFVIQFVFACLTMRTRFGYDVFDWLGKIILDFISFSDSGSNFIFGNDFKSKGFALAISGTIVFFTTMMFVFTHLGITDFVVLKLGRIISVCLETGPVESVVASANIFVSMASPNHILTAAVISAPAALALAKLSYPETQTVNYEKQKNMRIKDGNRYTFTKSELHSVMSSGFASTSGSLMVLFIMCGASPNHILTAAVISAPAALALAKLSYPETQTVNYAKQKNMRIKDGNSEGSNLWSVLSDGTAMGVKVAVSVLANLLSFISVMSLVDWFLGWCGERAGLEELSIEFLFSYLLWPLAYALGTEPADCPKMGRLIGVKLATSPLVAFTQMGQMKRNREELGAYLADTGGTGAWHWEGNHVVLDASNKTLILGIISERSEAIATYVLSGFNTVANIGITIGTLVQVCPDRKSDYIRLVFRAFMIGNMACFATAAVAG